jgi:hypothetical protein
MRKRIGAQLEVHTTNGLDSVWPGVPGLGASMPSMWAGVLLPEVTHRPRPFQAQTQHLNHEPQTAWNSLSHKGL